MFTLLALCQVHLITTRAPHSGEVTFFNLAFFVNTGSPSVLTQTVPHLTTMLSENHEKITSLEQNSMYIIISPYSNLFFCACVPRTANESSPIGSRFSSLLIHPLTAACTSCFCYIMTQSTCLTLHRSSSVTSTCFSQLTPPYHILQYICILSSSITGCTCYSASQCSTHLYSCPAILLKCRLDQRSWSLTLLIISWRGKKWHIQMEWKWKQR